MQVVADQCSQKGQDSLDSVTPGERLCHSDSPGRPHLLPRGLSLAQASGFLSSNTFHTLHELMHAKRLSGV